MHMEEEEKSPAVEDSDRNLVNSERSRAVRHYRGARNEESSRSGKINIAIRGLAHVFYFI